MSALRVIAVTGCSDCPWEQYVRGTEGLCVHPDLMDGGDGVPLTDGDAEAPPRWCPLRTTSTLVQIGAGR